MADPQAPPASTHSPRRLPTRHAGQRARRRVGEQDGEETARPPMVAVASARLVSPRRDGGRTAALKVSPEPPAVVIIGRNWRVAPGGNGANLPKTVDPRANLRYVARRGHPKHPGRSLSHTGSAPEITTAEKSPARCVFAPQCVRLVMHQGPPSPPMPCDPPPTLSSRDTGFQDRKSVV